jgi:hypothetical protein
MLLSLLAACFVRAMSAVVVRVSGCYCRQVVYMSGKEE